MARRRRRNPRGDLAGTALVTAVGAGAGAALTLASLLVAEGQTAAKPWWILGMMTALGASGGYVLARGYPALGHAVAAGAGATLGVAAGGTLWEKWRMSDSSTTQGMGRIPAYAVRKFGHTPEQPLYWNYPSPHYASR